MIEGEARDFSEKKDETLISESVNIHEDTCALPRWYYILSVSIVIMCMVSFYVFFVIFKRQVSLGSCNHF